MEWLEVPVCDLIMRVGSVMKIEEIDFPRHVVRKQEHVQVISSNDIVAGNDQ